MDEVEIQGFGPARLRFWHRLTHPRDRRLFFTVSITATLPDGRTIETRVPGITNYADGTGLADFLGALDPGGFDRAHTWLSSDHDLAVTAIFSDQVELTWRLWSPKGWSAELITPLAPSLPDDLRAFLTVQNPVAPAVVEEGVRWARRARDRSTGMSAPAWHAALDRTGAGPGSAVLDLACGSGEFCAEAAARGAEVFGIDASHGLIALASETVPDAEFHVWPLGPLPWQDRTFDVVTAFNALFFADDPQAAFAEACRVSGNHVVVCGWHPDLPSDMLTVARTVRGPSHRRHPELPPPQEELTIDVPLEFSGEDAMLRSMLTAGSFQPLIDTEGEAVVAEKIKAATLPFRRQGSYRLDNKYLMQIYRV